MATKRELLDDPNGCLNKAADDEPVFLLRAQDRLAPATVRDWCERARRAGDTPDEKVNEAGAVAIAMERWQEQTGRRKFPD